MTATTGVSFVVPVRNGASMIGPTLDSILAQADGRPFEIIVVDDGSSDDSIDAVNAVTASEPIRLLRRDGRGAAAALNAGIRAARHPVVCQVDQDVRLAPGWMRALLVALDEGDEVAAAQGYCETDAGATLCARVMGLDLEQRYGALQAETDHVCTGNVAYRVDALHRVGLFDEALGYGYDNDMSYRLRAAGYRLRFCRSARSVHQWRDGLAAYLGQQYGFGYGRLDLVAKHPARMSGDCVSPLPMMLHPLAMAAAVAALAVAVVSTLLGSPSPAFLAIGLATVGALAAERLVAGRRAVRRFGDRAAWLFPVLHLLRDLVWVAAILVWLVRRPLGRQARPVYSMRPRNGGRTRQAVGSR